MLSAAGSKPAHARTAMLDHTDVHLENGVCDAQTNGHLSGNMDADNTELFGPSGKVDAIHVHAPAVSPGGLVVPLHAA